MVVKEVLANKSCRADIALELGCVARGCTVRRGGSDVFFKSINVEEPDRT